MDGPLLLPPTHGVTICSLVNIMFEKLQPSLLQRATGASCHAISERTGRHLLSDLPPAEIIYRKCDGAVIGSSSALEFLGCCLVGTSTQKNLST